MGKRKAQRRAVAIAQHHPSELYARNNSLLGMTHEELHKFASTKEKNLPKRAPKISVIRNHGPLPDWDELPPKYQEAWREVAKEVCRLYRGDS